MSAGASLRRARLEAGLTLDRVYEITKIPLWILHSIEHDDLSRVPGGVFVRGYLQAFARTVGLDPSEILAEQFGPPQQPAVTVVPEVRRPVYTGTPLWQVAALIALVAATVVVWRNAIRTHADAPYGASRASDAGRPAVPSVVGTTGGDVVAQVPEPTPRPAAVQASLSLPAPTEPVAKPVEPGKLAVDVRATGQVWIEVTADGERKAYRLFNAGEELHVDAKQQVHLLLGDASAATYSVNGVPVDAPLGAPGEVRELTITP